MAGNDWRKTTVGILCDEGVLHTQTGPFGSQLHSYDYVSSGVPVVPTEGIGRRRLLTEGIPEVAEETAARLSRHRLKCGDILFARRGVQATGLSAIVEPKQEGWICGTGAILLRVLDESIQPEFLSFLLSADESVQWLKQHAVGAVMPNLNEGVIRQLPLTLPPLPEQKAIAAMLGALDDKIELNRRMNATLEAMARALFQSWFVDFDPVRAKLDGRKYDEHHLDTVGVFPSAFQDSELGHIPKGWRVGSIYEIADVIYGAPFASKLFNTNCDGRPLIRIRDLADESPAVFTTEVHPKGYLLKPGDIAVGMDGEFRAYLWAGVESWLNQRVCVFAPKPSFSAAFVRNSIIAPLAQVEATETATTVIHLGKNDIDRFKAVVATPEVHTAFTKICQPWYDKIVANKQESRTLATLRDTLLPKLLSGELSVAQIMKETA